MNESLARSPQVTGTVKADVTKVVGLRTRLKEEGVKYTYTEIFAKLVTEAIKQEPIMLLELGVKCIITLGGDGTNRAVAKGCGDTPIIPVSSGTNNVFPSMAPDAVTVITLGPLTNLALLLRDHPDLPRIVRRVVCMTSAM